MFKQFILALVALMPGSFAQSGSTPVAHYGLHPVTATSAVPLPDAKATPGVADPDAVADLSKSPHMVNGVERNICASDFRTAPIRSTIVNFEKLKKESCTAYAVTACDAHVEGDHLISLENGGCKDCLGNLWPEPVDVPGVVGYHTKDIVENRTHELICAGKVTLAQGQRGLANDWYQFAVDQGILPTRLTLPTGVAPRAPTSETTRSPSL
jgi:hypothetical protein